MNKKQFATKFMASVLSASFLVPCATTFGAEEKKPNNKTVSAQKRKQKKQETSIFKNPYVKTAEYGIGLGALIFGGSRLWKRFHQDRNPQDNNGAAPDPIVSPAASPVAPDPNPQPRPHVDPVPRPVTPPAPAPAPVATPEENRDGWNELHHAAENEQNAAVLYNLGPAQNKACFEARDALGRTPLYIAFKYRNQFFLEYFHNEYNFEQLYQQSPQEMYNFFIFDVLCTAARLNDAHTLNNMSDVIQHGDFKYKKASTDQNDYSLLNMALARGAQFAHERSLNLGPLEPGYSLLDIALRHNARNAAIYLMGQGVVFEMNNIFGNAAFTPEDKLAILNLLAENGYDFTGTDGHEPFDVRLVFGDAALTPENKLEFLNFLAEHGYDFAGTNGQEPFNMGLIFNDAALTPENKLAFLNFLAEHGRRFVNDDDRGSFIDRIFADPNLPDENRLEILRSLKDHGFDFKINGNRRPMSEACVQLCIATLKQRIVLVKFYIEDCNALSYMDGSDRNRIRKMLANKQELLAYFNQKCEDQPDAPNAQPANPAPTDTGHSRIDDSDDSDSEEDDDSDGDGSDSEEDDSEIADGTTSNPAGAPQQSTSPAQPQLTQEQIRARRLAALNRHA